jgi:hypothetical protein
MMVQTYIVTEDRQGKLEAILDPHDPELKLDLWMAGKKIVGCPASRSEQEAIDYVESILFSRR